MLSERELAALARFNTLKVKGEKFSTTPDEDAELASLEIELGI